MEALPTLYRIYSHINVTIRFIIRVLLLIKKGSTIADAPFLKINKYLQLSDARHLRHVRDRDQFLLSSHRVHPALCL